MRPRVWSDEIHGNRRGAGTCPAHRGRAQRADGTRFPVELAISVVQCTGPPLFTASLCDITERREAAKKLEESERRFRSGFEDAAIGMALLDLEGRWLSVNHAFCEMLGYTAARAPGHGLPDDHPPG